jgi:hypothetical protein
MATIDRRTILKDLLPGALVAAAGVSAVGYLAEPTVAEALPSVVQRTDWPAFVEEVQVVVVNPRRRRRRRWVCRWRRGRRVCGWRWV